MKTRREASRENGQKGGRPRKGRRRHEITKEAATALMNVAAQRLGRAATADEEAVVLSDLVLEMRSTMELRNEPCGCVECDNGPRPGHFACAQASEQMLRAEQAGAVVRAYDDGAWHWFPTEKYRRYTMAQRRAESLT